MNFRLILNIMGYTLWVEAGCLLLPLLVSAGYGLSLIHISVLPEKSALSRKVWMMRGA